jgi:hypothetical protein
MNIVQLQYKLRDMPESAVKAAANGQNPEIPEMLATMEMNRRERMEKAGAKPPTKSIKEQLEEKLSAQPQEQMGLPGMLQQAQQATGEPQQEQVQQPGQQMPQQVSMGGVAGLPSGGMFKQFNSGGIVAFAEGDLVESEDQSAAEVARLKRAEEIAAARELLAMSGVNQEPQAAPVRQAPAMPPEVQRANATIMQAPFVDEAGKAIREMTSVETTTPEQEMEKRQALLEKYGIRPPKEDEQARIEASNKAYAQDVARREALQGSKILAAAARPNVFGRYMPGTMGETASTFGLANLDADRAFREANEKSAVTAKEAQREFKMGNLSDAITASRKSEEYKREANKAAATATAQMAAHGLTALTQQLSTEENKRYHDMWASIEDKKLKAQIARDGQDKIPEVMKNIEYIKKNFPSIANSMKPEQLIELGTEISAAARGVPSRAETAYDAQVVQVNKIRQEAKKEATKTLRMQLDVLASTGKNPEKVQKLRDEIKAKEDAIDLANPYPTPPKGGLASLYPQAPAPAPTQAPPPAQTTRYDAQGRVVSRPAQPPNP